MSATNKTTNYDLPQYVSTDVPSYLGDFNSTMLKIDNAIKGVDNKATSAESAVATANANASEALESAQSASTKADTAQATATQAQSTANSANSTAGTAKSTADTAKSTAENAEQTAEQANTNVNSLSSEIDNWISSNIKPSSDATVTVSQMNFNKKLKLLNLYGDCDMNSNPQIRKIVGTLPENIRPKTDITIYAGCSLNFQGSGWQTRAFKIKSTGEIVMPDLDASSNITGARWNVMLYTSDDRWNIQ